MCRHVWDELPKEGNKKLFVFRCYRCRAKVALCFAGGRLAVDVLHMGAPAMHPAEVLHLLDLILGHFGCTCYHLNTRPKRHARRRAA